MFMILVLIQLSKQAGIPCTGYTYHEVTALPEWRIPGICDSDEGKVISFTFCWVYYADPPYPVLSYVKVVFSSGFQKEVAAFFHTEDNCGIFPITGEIVQIDSYAT